MPSSSSRLHPENAVTLDDSVEDVVAPDQPGENRVMAIEMGLWRVRQKVLTPTCIRTGQSHSHRAALVALPIHLVADGVSRATVAVVARITVLRDKIGNHAMKAGVPVIPTPCERKEVRHCDGRVSAVHLEPERPALRMNRRVYRSA